MVALIGLLLLGWLSAELFLPFIDPLVWAVAITASLRSPYARILKTCKGNDSIAAAMAVVLVTLLIVVPVLTLGLMLANQSLAFYDNASQWVASGDYREFLRLDHYPWLASLIDRLDPGLRRMGANFDPQKSLVDAAGQISAFLVGSLGTVAAGTTRFFLNFALMLVAMFFLFRDGRDLGRWIWRLSPLGREHDLLIARKFQDVISATLMGTLATAAAQGFAGGILFLILGIPNALLWGTMMAFLSFVPAVGAALVWAPAALYLWLGAGSPVKALLMVVGGAILVGSVDNVVKPLVMGQRAGMNSGLVLFSVLGGLLLYGFTGLVLGPMMVALLLTFVQIYRDNFADNLRTGPSVVE